MGTKLNSADLFLYKKIDEILYFDWNPIDVSDLPRDEYYAYLPEIYHLKKSGATIDQITETLFKMQSERMGIKQGVEICREVAIKIHEL